MKTVDKITILFAITVLIIGFSVSYKRVKNVADLTGLTVSDIGEIIADEDSSLLDYMLSPNADNFDENLIGVRIHKPESYDGFNFIHNTSRY